jgi:threonyl-tRNA synthetase
MVESGFYYDVDFGDESLSEKILKRLRKKFWKMLKKIYFSLYAVSKAEALKEYADNPYKVELIENLKMEKLLSAHDNFTDLCRGGHIPNNRNCKSS